MASCDAAATTLVREPWTARGGWDRAEASAELRSAIEAGADVRAKAEGDGKTVAMNAAAFSLDVDVVAFLLSKGADALATDATGKQALHHAASNTSKAAASFATALLAAGADPRTKDDAGSSPMDIAKKRKNAAVLPLLEAWQPPPPDEATLASVRSNGWFGAWTTMAFAAIDKMFDADACEVELLAITGSDDEVECHQEVATLFQALEAAFKRGEMGGGSFRQISQAKIGSDKVVGKLSKLKEDQHVLVVFCAAGKRDAMQKKIAKYNEKCGSRIQVAWASKEAYPVVS